VVALGGELTAGGARTPAVRTRYGPTIPVVGLLLNEARPKRGRIAALPVAARSRLLPALSLAVNLTTMPDEARVTLVTAKTSPILGAGPWQALQDGALARPV
jgi:hypothetical protein